ncbi:MAG: Panacea domain-containing protein [Armatimonadota bacterium]
MVTVHDVAATILKICGPMSAMKLQKLVYYAQAWSLVWDDRALFPERIEAWAFGPVVPELYEMQRGQFSIAEWPAGDSSKLDAIAVETVSLVASEYGKRNAQELSDSTNRELPWVEARKGLGTWERGNREITLAAMSEYYSSLLPDEQTQEAAV